MKKTQTFLVTGGAGFLGSHLCQSLIALGHKVICVDNLMTCDGSNITELKKDPKFRFIFHDVTEPLNIEEDIDTICHLACPASPPTYQKDSIQTSKICFLGTLNFLELAKQKEALFFYASTSEVYGDPEVHPQVERYRGCVNSFGPRACYDEGKRIGESLCYDYHHQHQVPIKIVRIFNTYGPNMDPNDGRVISNFINQALNNEKITVYGDGSQSRSFCYVDDLIRGFLAFLNEDIKHTGPINLGNPEEYTILELANSVLSLIETSTSDIEYRELPTDDPTQRCPNIELAKSVLKWMPRIGLQEGLLKSIAYFQSLSHQAKGYPIETASPLTL